MATHNSTSVSLPDDIEVLINAIEQLQHRRRVGCKACSSLYCQKSATALRFLTVTALFETTQTTLLTDPQLFQRVAQDDLSFIRALGGDIILEPSSGSVVITPTEKRHFEPLQATWTSSQYASALQICSYGYDLNLQFPLPSSSHSYFTLTKAMIERKQRGLQPALEFDWSAASFWYQLIASRSGFRQLKIRGLSLDSAQPDRQLPELFEPLGVRTSPVAEGILLTLDESHSTPKHFELSLEQNLDLFLPLALTLIRRGVTFRFTGITSLRQKESNRISAFLEEVGKYGVVGFTETRDSLEWDGSSSGAPLQVTIESHDDHRVAMAFGVFATTSKGVKTHLAGYQAARKSYPDFFRQLLS